MVFHTKCYVTISKFAHLENICMSSGAFLCKNSYSVISEAYDIFLDYSGLYFQYSGVKQKSTTAETNITIW